MKGIEPPTPSLPWKCSTPELHWLLFFYAQEAIPVKPICSYTLPGLKQREFAGCTASFHRLYTISKLSGRRDSNPRPSAWKADALPTELLPPVYIFSIFTAKSGGGKIRTYSVRDTRFTVWPGSPTPAHPLPFLPSQWRDSNPRPADYKSAALAS